MRHCARTIGVSIAVALLLSMPAAGAVAIKVQPYEVEGVDVALIAVQRTSGNTITVRWEYRNKTGERKRLTNQRTGWIDPYRLSADAYLLDAKHQLKLPVLRDSTNHPIAATHGSQNAYIYIEPHRTLATWAKFPAPSADSEVVTVAIPGVTPFEDVPIAK